jgi:hypothetical protein
MSPHADAREAFNRASHSDALREMQLAPAEEIQRDPVSILRTIPAREIAGWFAVFGVLAVVAAGWAVIL